MNFDDKHAPRVLVVDDDSTFLLIASEILGKTGFVAGSAASGEEALDVARGFRPELVLMDVSLPGMDGIETARRIRGICGREVSVVVTTGRDDAETARRARAAGAVDFIPKPIHWEMFLDRVQCLIDVPRQIRARTRAEDIPAAHITRRAAALA